MIIKQGIAFNALIVAAFLSAPLAIFSGLVLAPVLIILTIAALFAITKIHTKINGLRLIAYVLVVFMIWALITSIRSESIISWLQTATLLIAGFICILVFSGYGEIKKAALHEAIIYGTFLAILFAIEETITDGIITRYFRYAISGGNDFTFDIYYLNRGACYITLMFWPFAVILGYVLRPIVMIFIWLFILLTLLSLASLSAIVAFIAATCTFLWCYLFKGKLNIVPAAFMVIIMIMTPFAALKLEPNTIINNYSTLQKSASHRLHIWHFASEKALEKMWFGWGFDASKSIPGGSDKIPEHDEWTYLPLHPHNNIIQIWLELGIVGLSLFILSIIFVLYAINTSKLTSAQQAAAMALVVGYLSIGMTGFGIWQHWWVAAGFLSTCFMMATLKLRQ